MPLCVFMALWQSWRVQYYVTGHDGVEYGPADTDTLREWAGQNRLSPDSMLRDAHTGQVIPAGNVPEIWGAPASVQVPAVTAPPQTGPIAQVPFDPAMSQPYGFSPAQQGPGAYKDPILPFLFVLGWCALALVLFFVFHGIGIIIAAFTIFDAVKIMRTGSRYGIPALVAAIVTTAIIGVGWLGRAGG